MIVEADLKLFADYFQIYLADSSFDDDWSDGWKEPSALEDRLLVRPRVLVFVTERNMTVPVHIVAHKAVCDLSHELSRADHAVRAGLLTKSERLIVAGCTDYRQEAFSIHLSPGFYCATFLSFGLGSVQGLEGDDRYELHIWELEQKPEPEVLVRWRSKQRDDARVNPQPRSGAKRASNPFE
jgi:hypothetical protein